MMSKSPRGKLLVIEGPDGAGKTTLARSIAALLREEEIRTELIREPGGTALSEQIRLLLKGQTSPDTEIDTRAETLLFCAARAQLCRETIEPQLESGTWVILDRFEGSTLVYQGIMRGLGEEVLEVSRFARGGVEPDRILVIDVLPETALERMAGRGEHDRIEEETVSQIDIILQGYREFAASEERATLISGEGDPAAVLGRALLSLKDLF